MKSGNSLYLDQVVGSGNRAFFQEEAMYQAIRESAVLALTTAPTSAEVLRTAQPGPSSLSKFWLKLQLDIFLFEGQISAG